MEGDVRDLSKYRFETSLEDLEDAKIMFENLFYCFKEGSERANRAGRRISRIYQILSYRKRDYIAE